MAEQEQAMTWEEEKRLIEKDNIFENNHMDDDWTKSKAKLFMKEFKEKYGDDDDGKEFTFEDEERQQILANQKKKGCFPSTYQDKVVLLIYFICILSAIALTVIYIIMNQILARIGSLIAILIVTWIGVIVAMITIYNGGTVRAQADEVKQENDTFQASLDELVNIKRDQFKSIKRLLNEYKTLDETQMKLNEQTKKFNGLVQEFESLRKDWPAIKEISNNLKVTDTILSKIHKSNERAKLFDAFYEAERDGKPGLSEYEFRLFYRKVPKRYQEKMERLKVKEYSTWDHDGDGNIDTLEFEKMIKILLDDANET